MVTTPHGSVQQKTADKSQFIQTIVMTFLIKNITVTAIEVDDELNVRTLTFICEVPDNNFDLISAMKAAAKDFCLSETGKKVYSSMLNCHCFNWGDFDIYVTEEYQRKYGFRVINTGVSEETRDYNEQLVSESDIFPED